MWKKKVFNSTGMNNRREEGERWSSPGCSSQLSRGGKAGRKGEEREREKEKRGQEEELKNRSKQKWMKTKKAYF